MAVPDRVADYDYGGAVPGCRINGGAWLGCGGELNSRGAVVPDRAARCSTRRARKTSVL